MNSPQIPRKVHLLDPTVAERIAAGEVIERPASVVKELIENSIDAGASEISVILEEGGKSLIEIIDNGSGMSPEDLELCIERHATSKLSTLQDLEAIHTLGFRGEALASISAVTDLQIISRTADSNSAFEVIAGDLAERLGQRAGSKRAQAQRVTHGQFINSKNGTVIRARGLFSQVPARLKFLKSQSSEVSQIREWIERIAIAHPEVGFQLVSNDRTVLRLAPSTEALRVQSILGEGDEYPVITGSLPQDGFRDQGLDIRVHWLQGLSSPQSRKLIQVVNGRSIRDRMLQQALLMPFRQLLLPGQFPALALFIEINPAALDVNVHPTKTEIRFLDSRKIFQSIESVIKTMISDRGAPAVVPREFLFSSPSAAPASFPWKSAEPTFFPRSTHEPQEIPITPTLNLFSKTAATEGFLQSFDRPQFSAETPNYPDWAHSPLIGIFFQTYIAFESSMTEEMVLVDQHAAHERIRYEKLKKRILDARNGVEYTSQILLVPEIIKFLPEYQLTVSERVSWFSQMGFDAELFGEDTLVFRSVPAEWGYRDLKVRLKNLVDRVVSAETQGDPNLLPNLLVDERLFESLASEACHSAIRAGDSIEPIEGRELIRQLFLCENPWNCPHGRPTVVKISRGKLEEWFQRKI